MKSELDINEDEIADLVRVTEGEAFVLEIGAMDGLTHDSLYSYINKFDLNGLLVEPLPDMFEKLIENYANRTRLQFANVAITEESGERFIYRIDSESIKQNNLPEYSDGLSSFFLDQNAIGWEIYKPYIRQERVQCMTLRELTDQFSVTRVDLLQIDTEGYDFCILKQFDFQKYSPYIIKIETWDKLKGKRKRILELLEGHGYTCRFFFDDIIGTKHLDLN